MDDELRRTLIVIAGVAWTLFLVMMIYRLVRATERISEAMDRQAGIVRSPRYTGPKPITPDDLVRDVDNTPVDPDADLFDGPRAE